MSEPQLQCIECGGFLRDFLPACRCDPYAEERKFVAINRSVGEWRDIVEYLRNAIDKRCYGPTDCDNVEAIAESIEANLPPAPAIL